MKEIKAIIFDLDGVLVDSKDWHYVALNKALSRLRYRKIQKQEHLSRFDGLPTGVKLRILADEARIREHDIDTLETYKRQEFNSMLKSKKLYNKRIAEDLLFLNFLGFKLGLASNAIKSTVTYVLNKMRINKLFHSILSNEDVEKRKPNPDIYIKSMNDLGVSPEQTVIFEDNANGIASAKLSGAHVVIVNSSKDINLDNIFKRLNNLINNAS